MDVYRNNLKQTERTRTYNDFMSYSKKALRRECRENGLEPERYYEDPVYTLQSQLGRHYYKRDHASKGDVSKHKVGDTFRVSDYPCRGYATATVIEVHRTDEGFVYKIKVKRTGQAEKEELVKEDALGHNVNYDNMCNPQQYYLDYHKRKEQEALVELVKAKDEQPNGAQETSEEALQVLFEKVKAAALSLPDDDDSEAGFMLKMGFLRAIECYGGSRDVDGAMRALKEVEKFA